MKNLNLIKKISRSFHNSTGIELKELIGEASLAYCEALQSFNPKKSKLSTWAWNNITYRLMDFCRKENQTISYDFDLVNHFTNNNPNEKSHKPILPSSQQSIPFTEAIEEWDDDLQFIVQIVLKDFENSIENTPPKIIRGLIVKQLRKENWAWSRIWNSFRQIKTYFSEEPELCIL